MTNRGWKLGLGLGLALGMLLGHAPALGQAPGAAKAAVRAAVPAEAGRVAGTDVQAAVVSARSEPGLTLEETLSLALSRSRSLEQARLQLETAEEQVREAWGSVYPKLDLSTTYTRNLSVPVNFLPARIFDPAAGEDDLVGVKFGSDNNYAFSLTAEQPLFQASAFVGVGVAGRYEGLQQETVRGTAQAVVTDARVGFYDVLLAQEALRLNEQSLSRVRQTLSETQAMNRAGLSSDYDVLRLEVEVANLEPNVRRSENQLAAARRGLGVLLGIDAPDTLRVRGDFGVLAAELVAAAGTEPGTDADAGVARLASSAGDAAGAGPVTDGTSPWSSMTEAEIDAVVRQAVQERSDLRQLQLQRQLREAEVKVERSEYLPKVYLFGTYSVNAQDNGGPTFFGEADQRAFGRQIGIRVSMPLFSGFQRPARLQQKEYAVQQVDAQYRLAADQAENEVRTLIEQVRESQSRAAAQRRAVQQAGRGYEIARTQYREGLGSQLEVTDAELALRQSEFNHAQAVYDYLVARARLDAATGTVPLVDEGTRIALSD